MSSALQLRKGTTASHATFTGLNAEVTVDTTKKVVVVHDGVTAGGQPLAKQNGDATQAFATANLTVSGDVVASGNVTAYSDRSLKTDIRTIPEALAKVEALRGVLYTYIDTGDHSTGVIAQEIQKVLPEVVQQNDTGLLSVAYGNIVGVLIEAIKELSEKVKQLENK